MQFEHMQDWGLLALIGGSCHQIVTHLSKITRSIEKLNVNMAVLLEKVMTHERRHDRTDERLDNHEEQIQHLDGRVTVLETKKK